MSELKGPFPLTHEDVISRIPRGARGVYVLITLYEGDPYVRYVGRSDSDLGRELLGLLGEYDQYAFQICEDEIASFLVECNTFHDYGGLKMLANALHPEPPL